MGGTIALSWSPASAPGLEKGEVRKRETNSTSGHNLRWTSSSGVGGVETPLLRLRGPLRSGSLHS